jgi:hypothetical protein
VNFYEQQGNRIRLVLTLDKEKSKKAQSLMTSLIPLDSSQKNQKQHTVILLVVPPLFDENNVEPIETKTR